jgi:hypothetical protein
VLQFTIYTKSFKPVRITDNDLKRSFKHKICLSVLSGGQFEINPFGSRLKINLLKTKHLIRRDFKLQTRFNILNQLLTFIPIFNIHYIMYV